MANRSVLQGAALLMLSLFGPSAESTVNVELLSSAIPGDSAGGASTSQALSRSQISSDDGRWALYASAAANLVPGVTDYNGSSDVFLYDRDTNQSMLVSRSAASSNRAANGVSLPTAISSDGRYVLFYSAATDLVSGVTDDNGSELDVFLFDRISQSTVLVSRSGSSSNLTANGSSRATALSADGRYVLYSSVASNLVSGLTDENEAADIFLFDRDNSTSILISHPANAPTTTLVGDSQAVALSADGAFVLFSSTAPDVVSGISDNNGANPDVFLYERASGIASLVSRSASSASQTGNDYSRPIAFSADGLFVLYSSAASDVLPGITDNNGVEDVFLYDRINATALLVSRSAGSATITANNVSIATTLSADGRYVLFASDATDVVTGVSDGNNDRDVFLFDRNSGTSGLVSRSGPAATTTANNAAYASALSADGRYVLYASDATNVITGLVDTNNSADVFLFDRNNNSSSLVSRTASSSGQTANAYSEASALSADGRFALLFSYASDLVAGSDLNNNADVFLFDRVDNSNALISRATAGSSTANGDSIGKSLSSDGRYALYSSMGNNLISGVTDNNFARDVFLVDRQDNSKILVSRAASAPTNSANGNSEPVALSADGRYVLFVSNATNLVSGISDNNGDSDVFLFDRDTGVNTLISRSSSSAASAAGFSQASALSPDGRYVLFYSNASDLVSGISDGNGTADVFVYDRVSGTSVLVSRSAAAANVTADDYSLPSALSDDGRFVLFFGYANNVVNGVTDINGSADVFLFDRTSGENTLISRSASSATSTPSGQSQASGLSADGRYAVFYSDASDVINGVTDNNSGNDIFVFDTINATTTLVSHAAGTQNLAANDASEPPTLSSDGRYLLFSSLASDLVSGLSDNNASSDVFLFDRNNGVTALVSRSNTVATETANGSAQTGAVSANGRYILYASDATNVVGAVADNNFGADVFLFDRDSGVSTLLSRSIEPGFTANNASMPAALSADGSTVLFSSAAEDLVTAADGNDTLDVFVASIFVPEATQTLISSDLPDPSVVGQSVNVQVTVTGNLTAPADGSVTVIASTGESCTDSSASAGTGNEALFSCALQFNSVGARDLTAGFAGSSSHADSTSPINTHEVQALPTLSITDVSQLEGSGGTSNLVFIISRSHNLNDLSVEISTANGSAAAGSDFTAINASNQNFAAGGATSASVSVSLNTDSVVESNETFLLQLSNAIGATISDGEAVGTILNDDTASVAISESVLQAEGTGAASTFTFAVTLTGEVQDGFTLPYQSADGSALAGSDYTSASGTLNFSGSNGQIRNVAVAVTGDSLAEADEQFFIDLGTASSAAISASIARGTATIINDDLFADIVVSNSNGVSSLLPGQITTYAVTISNTSSFVDVPVVQITQTLSTALTGVSWTCIASGGASCPANGSGAINVSTAMPKGSTLSYQVNATVNASALSSINATVSASVQAPYADPNLSNNSVTDSDPYTPPNVFANGFE